LYLFIAKTGVNIIIQRYDRRLRRSILLGLVQFLYVSLWGREVRLIRSSLWIGIIRSRRLDILLGLRWWSRWGNCPKWVVEFFWWNYRGGTRRFEGEVPTAQGKAERGSKKIQEGGGAKGQYKTLQNVVQVRPISKINLQGKVQSQRTSLVLNIV